MKTILFIYLIFIVGAFLGTIKDFGCMTMNPKQIYECNNINMFACVCLYIVALILNPLFFLVHFLYWIFHIGRKD